MYMPSPCPFYMLGFKVSFDLNVVVLVPQFNWWENQPHHGYKWLERSTASWNPPTQFEQNVSLRVCLVFAFISYFYFLLSFFVSSIQFVLLVNAHMKYRPFHFCPLESRAANMLPTMVFNSGSIRVAVLQSCSHRTVNLIVVKCIFLQLFEIFVIAICNWIAIIITNHNLKPCC